MRRPVEPRDGAWGALRTRFPALAAVSGPTIGFLAVGLSGFALLAASPRLLGSAQHALLAVAWTVANVIGIGLAQPGEQAVSRAAASHALGDLPRRVRNRLMVVTAILVLLPLAGRAGLDPVFGGSQLWAWSIVLSSFGWALVAPVRGFLAGRGKFGAYALTLAAEAAVRLVLVVTAWLGVGDPDVILASSLGVPLLASALVGRLLVTRVRAGAVADETRSEAREAPADQFWYTAVAFSIQVSLALPAILLQADDPESGAAGFFVTASAYFRIPITFIGGLAVVVLSQVATYFSSGRVGLAARVTRRALEVTAVLGVAGAASLWLVSDTALVVLYGDEFRLPGAALALLACGTVMAMVAGILTQALFGCAQARSTAFIWMTVAVAVTISSALLPGSTTAMAAVILAGQSLAFLGMGVPAFSALGSVGRTRSPAGT